MKALTVGLLALVAGWVLLPHGGSFSTAGACNAEAAAWAARTQEGSNWVARRYQEALHQTDPAVTAFWFKSERMAAGEVEQARAARCFEVRP